MRSIFALAIGRYEYGRTPAAFGLPVRDRRRALPPTEAYSSITRLFNLRLITVIAFSKLPIRLILSSFAAPREIR